MGSGYYIPTAAFAFNILFSDILVLFIMYTTGSTLPREDFWQHLCNEKTQEVWYGCQGPSKIASIFGYYGFYFVVYTGSIGWFVFHLITWL